MEIRIDPVAATLQLGPVIAIAMLAANAAAAPPPPLPNLEDSAIIGAVRSALPRPVPGGKEIVILKLRGEFADFGVDGTCISPYALKLMLTVGKDRKPAVVVLDIESPGGLVSAMDAVVDQILRAQAEDGIRVVAWPKDAHSAAAVTCLACKEIVVRPLSRVGAATVTAGENEAPKPETAMDHKVESSKQARRRQIAAATGRDIRVLDAMQYPERELWFKQGSGFSESPQSGEGWIALDDSTDAPATLNASELLSTGIALGQANGVEELRAALKLPSTSQACIIDLADSKVRAALKPSVDAVSKWIAWRDNEADRFRKLVIEKIKKYDAAILKLEALGAGNGWTATQQDELARAVKNCSFLPKLDPDFAAAMKDTPWLACKEATFETAKVQADLAATAIKPQSTGSGRMVDLELAHERLLVAHNALVHFVNGCVEE